MLTPPFRLGRQRTSAAFARLFRTPAVVDSMERKLALKCIGGEPTRAAVPNAHIYPGSWPLPQIEGWLNIYHSDVRAFP